MIWVLIARSVHMRGDLLIAYSHEIWQQPEIYSALRQVLEHEKSKNADKPGFMQAMWAAVTTTEDQEEADFASGSAAAGKTRPQVAVITASGDFEA